MDYNLAGTQNIKLVPRSNYTKINERKIHVWSQIMFTKLSIILKEKCFLYHHYSMGGLLFE